VSRNKPTPVHSPRTLLPSVLLTILVASAPVLAQEVFSITYTVQDRRLGLVQPEAAAIIRSANDWLTRDNPNISTARSDDPLRVTLTGTYSSATNGFVLSPTKLVMGSIVVEDGLEQILDSTQRARLVGRTLFWREEETAVSGTSLVPPTLRDTLSAASVLPRSSARAATTSTVEWSIGTGQLAAVTRLALERYHLLFARDTFRVRYLRALPSSTPIRLRARFTAGDTGGTLLNVRLGQAQVYGPTPVRTALGDDLVDALIASLESGEDKTVTPDGLPSAHEDWSREWNAIAALDRLDVSVAPATRAFLEVGDPRHNGDGWLDGTWRIGVAGQFGEAIPSYEGALLLPFPGGARAVGPLRERLLQPATGGAAMVRWSGFQVAARYARPYLRSDHPGYVHTVSADLSYQTEFSLAGFPLRVEIGGELEQYSGSDSLGTILQPFPSLLLGWRDRNDIFRATLGVTNAALRATGSVRVGDRFWIEVRGFWNEAFRARYSFEHPAMIVFTPRLYF